MAFRTPKPRLPLLQNPASDDPLKWETIRIDSKVFDGEKGNEAVLREIVNTVGKKGKAGERVRCIVSVNMLSEGWDVKSVTHILGLRAFGSPLLTEQIIGRGLRRTSYDGLLTPIDKRDIGIYFWTRRALDVLENEVRGTRAGTVEPEAWIDASSIGRLDQQMFVARAVGHSMEPRIHDGDYCVFRANPKGTRQGRIVLVQYRGPGDPETGGAFTLKRYRSEKRGDANVEWRHSQIILEALNPEYQPIILLPEAESDVKIAAEYLATLS